MYHCIIMWHCFSATHHVTKHGCGRRSLSRFFQASNNSGAGPERDFCGSGHLAPESSVNSSTGQRGVHPRKRGNQDMRTVIHWIVMNSRDSQVMFDSPSICQLGYCHNCPPKASLEPPNHEQPSRRVEQCKPLEMLINSSHCHYLWLFCLWFALGIAHKGPTSEGHRYQWLSICKMSIIFANLGAWLFCW